MRRESGSGKVQLIVPGIQPCAAAPATRAEDAHDLSLEVGLQLITEGLHLCLFDNLHPPGRTAQNDPMAGVADLHRIHIRYRRQQHISSCLFSTDCDSLCHSFRIPCRRIKNDRYFLSHLDLLTGE